LTTQDQKLTRENHDHKGPGSFIRNCCKNTHTNPKKGISHVCVLDARVHYVVLKQQPRQPDHHPPQPPPKKGSHAHERPYRKQEQKKHQKCPLCIAAKRSCCLRTQQCAKHNPTPTTPQPRSTQPTPPKRDTDRRTSTRTQPVKAMPKKFDSLIFHP